MAKKRSNFKPEQAFVKLKETKGWMNENTTQFRGTHNSLISMVVSVQTTGGANAKRAEPSRSFTAWQLSRVFFRLDAERARRGVASEEEEEQPHLVSGNHRDAFTCSPEQQT